MIVRLIIVVLVVDFETKITNFFKFIENYIV